MRKRKLVIIVLAVCLLCFTAFAACTDKTDYGTLTVADVTVTVGQSKDLTPAFSKDGTFTITGSGSGHNLGMSQYGAKAMAEMGYTYDEILEFYYTDITIK